MTPTQVLDINQKVPETVIHRKVDADKSSGGPQKEIRSR